MLGAGLVHGGLSPYYILVWEGKAWIIDLPQAVDLYRNDGAMGLLYRDLSNVADYFSDRGVESDASDLF